MLQSGQLLLKPGLDHVQGLPRISLALANPFLQEVVPHAERRCCWRAAQPKDSFLLENVADDVPHQVLSQLAGGQNDQDDLVQLFLRVSAVALSGGVQQSVDHCRLADPRKRRHEHEGRVGAVNFLANRELLRVQLKTSSLGRQRVEVRGKYPALQGILTLSKGQLGHECEAQWAKGHVCLHCPPQTLVVEDLVADPIQHKAGDLPGKLHGRLGCKLDPPLGQLVLGG